MCVPGRLDPPRSPGRLGGLAICVNLRGSSKQWVAFGSPPNLPLRGGGANFPSRRGMEGANRRWEGSLPTLGLKLTHMGDLVPPQWIIGPNRQEKVRTPFCLSDGESSVFESGSAKGPIQARDRSRTGCHPGGGDGTDPAWPAKQPAGPVGAERDKAAGPAAPKPSI